MISGQEDRSLSKRREEQPAQQRPPGAGEARVEFDADPDTAIADRERPARARWRSWPAIAAPAGTLLLFMAAAGLGNYFRSAPAAPAATAPTTAVRFPVFPPAGAPFDTHPSRGFFALAPDGSQLAFVTESDGTSRLWLRSLADLESRVVPGTEGALSPFWSPDSQSLAFFADRKLKRIDLPGGAAISLCDVPSSVLSHGTWGTDGEILVATAAGGPILSVPADGGAAEAIVAPDSSQGETFASSPWFLPDGTRFLYVAQLIEGGARLKVTRKGATPRTLMSVESNVQYVDPGYLLFVREGVLLAQPFDQDHERLEGEPFSVVEGVSYVRSTLRAMFSASRSGALAYHAQGDVNRLTWTDRTGQEDGAVGSAGDYEFQSLRISARGDVALAARRRQGLGTYDLWRLDLVRGTEEQLTTDPGNEVTPVWLPGERAIVFAGDHSGGPPHLFRRDLVSGLEDELLPAGRQQLAMDAFPDGSRVAFLERGLSGHFDILSVPLTAPAQPAPLAISLVNKFDMRLSPDGRAMTFATRASRHMSVYLAPLSDPTGAVLVASNVRSPARWNPDGRQVYYVSSDGRMTAVPVRTSPSFSVGTPSPRFALPETTVVSGFEVAPNGRFLMIVPDARARDQPLTVVTDWLSPLRDR